MSSIRVLALGVSLALASVLPACSSASTAGNGGGDGGASGADGGGGATPNYCGLISVAEMVQLTGAPVTHIFKTSDGLGCDYLFDNDAMASAAGTTLLFFVKDAAASYQAAKQPHMDYVVTDLPGVGDAAFSVSEGGGAGHEVVAMKGTTAVVILGFQDAAASKSLSVDTEAKIANMIFARLP